MLSSRAASLPQVLFVALLGFAIVMTAPDSARAQAPAHVPTIWLIGDSTVKVGTKDQKGWGDAIQTFFDAGKIRIVNRARGGRSSRTYRTEGLWQAVLNDLKPGDFVLMQFGHNDGGGLSDPRNRASIKGNGDETQEVMIVPTPPAPGAAAPTTPPAVPHKEIVHSYGWYMRQYVAEAKAKGAIPIVLSPIPRNIWDTTGKTVNRAGKDYGLWARQAAEVEKVTFVDLNEIIARRYETLGKESVQKLFGATDHTHTNDAGATINAESVIAGLKGIPQSPFLSYLSPEGAKIEPFATK